MANPKIRAVNLGEWLVLEHWIKPSLFDGIPNKDFLDGTRLQFKSVTQKKYVCAEEGSGSTVVVNRRKADIWETFRLWRITSNTFLFRVNNGQFVGLDDQGNLVATSTDSSRVGTFEIVMNRDDPTRVRILAKNGFFLQAKSDVSITADYDKETTNWGDGDPSVFQMTRIQGPQGDFEFANGYTSELETEVLREGLRLQFKSVTQQKYLCAENGGGTSLVVNRVTPLEWETFKLWRISSSSFMLRVDGGQFIGLTNQGTAVATSMDPDNAHQKFEILVNADFSRARIKAKNGNFLQVKSDVLVRSDYIQQDTDWGDDDPSVLAKGQVKITSGYGAELGLRVLNHGSRMANPKVKAVNLGGWLVLEQWIKTSLFDGIPNRDFLDGTRLQFKSVTQKKYVCAENGGGSTVVVNRDKADAWETFRLWRITSNTFLFRVDGGQFVGLDDQGNLVATSTDSSRLDTFEIVMNRDDPTRVRILSKNGFFVQAKSDVLITADYDKETTDWGDGDPSVFQMTRIQGPQGDFQFANGYTSELETEVLREGLRLQFKSVTQQKYLCAENGGGTNLVVNRDTPLDWETFKLWRISSSSFMLRVNGGQFIGLTNQGTAVATSTDPDNAHQKFEIVVNADFSRARIKAKNGNYLQAKSDVLVTADYSQQDTDWGDDDPSVFMLTRIPDAKGQVKITSGYGAELGLRVLTDHWNTFIVEDDFRFMSQSNLNSVRIPVGWWITSDTIAPFPFFAGTLQALDNAFTWAEKYNMKVIIDLHAVPGSQNGDEHSATRDGTRDWGKTDDSINQSVAVIDFLAARYANRKGLLAVELLNEPRAEAVPLDVLTKYYKAGYDAVRKYSSDAYVIMCNRLSSNPETELIAFASGFRRVVIDLHYYNLFWPAKFDGMNAAQNIAFINNDRAAQVSVMNNNNGGVLMLVGEWTTKWGVKDATKQDCQNFAQAQLNVFGRATFGWAFWCYKNDDQYWSMEWMLKNGYITL